MLVNQQNLDQSTSLAQQQAGDDMYAARLEEQAISSGEPACAAKAGPVRFAKWLNKARLWSTDEPVFVMRVQSRPQPAGRLAGQSICYQHIRS
jgi:hypothetical protein